MVWDVLPFLPQAGADAHSRKLLRGFPESLIDELSSKEFEQSCDEFFAQLDKDAQSGIGERELLNLPEILGKRSALLCSARETAVWRSSFHVLSRFRL